MTARTDRDVEQDQPPARTARQSFADALADALAGAVTGAVTSAGQMRLTQRTIVQAATLAPSIHNSQPWRFTADDSGLDLYADGARRLPVLDPDGRLVHLSCGAALLNAQVAARALGFRTASTLLPDPVDPGHLARLELTPGVPGRPEDHALAHAILQRRTHRDAFEQRTLSPELLEELRLGAEEHGAALVVVSGDDLIELEVLLAWADGLEEADPAYRAETAASIRTGFSPDGIPATALADDPERGSSLRLRDFAFVGPRPTGGEPPRAEKPDVVLITADGDGPLPWLRAGQALGAVLLRAAQHGVMGQPLGQATDLRAGRLRLRTALGLVGTPQMALRLGYASTAEPTPRRPFADVLTRGNVE
jgi:nitroreductase